MNILGINSVYHDSAAALLVDGKLVVAVEEERFNRIKHGKLPHVDNPHQFPEQAIRFCLNYAGLTADDIDHMAYSFDPQLRRTRFRAEWWGDPRVEETFLLRLGQVRGVADKIFRTSAAAKISFRAPPSGACRVGLLSRQASIARRSSSSTASARRPARPCAKAEGTRIETIETIRLSAFAGLPVGGRSRLSRLLDLRRLEGHGPRRLRRSPGLPPRISVDHAESARRDYAVDPEAIGFQSAKRARTRKPCSVRRGNMDVEILPRHADIAAALQEAPMRPSWHSCGGSSARCRSTICALPAASRSIA